MVSDVQSILKGSTDGVPSEGMKKVPNMVDAVRE